MNHQPTTTVTLSKPPTQFIQQMPNWQQVAAHIPNPHTMLNQSPPHFNIQRITMNNTFQPSLMPQAQQMQPNHPYPHCSQLTEITAQSKHYHCHPYIPEPQNTQQNRMQNNIVQMDKACFLHKWYQQQSPHLCKKGVAQHKTSPQHLMKQSQNAT